MQASPAAPSDAFETYPGATLRHVVPAPKTPAAVAAEARLFRWTGRPDPFPVPGSPRLGTGPGVSPFRNKRAWVGTRVGVYVPQHLAATTVEPPSATLFRHLRPLLPLPPKLACHTCMYLLGL